MKKVHSIIYIFIYMCAYGIFSGLHSQCLRGGRQCSCGSWYRCVAVCCSVLQCVAVCCNVLQVVAVFARGALVQLWELVQVCCSVLPCVAVCCSVLQCFRVCCSVLQCLSGGCQCSCGSWCKCVRMCCSVLQCVAAFAVLMTLTLCMANAATHCNTLQHTATHCNTLQHTATHCNTLQHVTLCMCRVYCDASCHASIYDLCGSLSADKLANKSKWLICRKRPAKIWYRDMSRVILSTCLQTEMRRYVYYRIQNSEDVVHVC